MRVTRLARRAVRNAFFSRGFRLFGLRFARDYLRFARRAARQWGHTGANVVELVGIRLAYPNQSHALYLVHEIFVDAIYAFRAPGTAPRIIDCGANIGVSVAFFKARFPRATIVAIEADSATFEYLQSNVATNGWRDVELINAAVAREEGTLTFYAHPSDPGSVTASLNPAWGGAVRHPVRAMRLSSIVTEPVDFLKLDVEGAEYDVLADLIETGAIHRIREMILECHDLPERPRGRDELIEQLEGAGLRVDVLLIEAEKRLALLRARHRDSGVQSGPKRVPRTSRTTSA